MTVVMNTNLVINIAKTRKANLDLSIAMVKLSLSLSLLVVSWVLRCCNVQEYHQFSLSSDGFIGLAGVAMLINITSSSLSLFFLMVLWVLQVSQCS